MSYDIRFAVKGYPDDRMYVVFEPDFAHPTYNIGEMLRKAMNWNFHQGEWYCLIGVVPCIERGIHELTYNPEAYGQYEPKNGWGTVSGALECLRNLRETIKDHLNGYDWNEYDIDHLYISW